jgi:hypothetical protein
MNRLSACALSLSFSIALADTTASAVGSSGVVTVMTGLDNAQLVKCEGTIYVANNGVVPGMGEVVAIDGGNRRKRRFFHPSRRRYTCRQHHRIFPAVSCTWRAAGSRRARSMPASWHSREAREHWRHRQEETRCTTGRCSVHRATCSPSFRPRCPLAFATVLLSATDGTCAWRLGATRRTGPACRPTENGSRFNRSMACVEIPTCGSNTCSAEHASGSRCLRTRTSSRSGLPMDDSSSTSRTREANRG